MTVSKRWPGMIAAVLLAIALAALAAAPAFAEGDEGAADPVAFENEELDLDMTELCHYYDKDDYDSTVYYTLSLESGTAAFFSTSAKSVARIDEEDEGSVTLHLRKPGSVTIRAHNDDGNAVAACRLNITATLKDLEVKAVSDNEYDDEYSGTIAPGKTLQLKACVFPSFVPEPEISWSSSNEECAEVDEAGLVTLKKRGPVKITAEATGGISDEYPVVWSEKVVSGDYTYRVINTDEAEIVSYDGTDKEVVIPETLDGYRVTAIGGYHYNDDGSYSYGAFSGCDQLQKITIPRSIKTIGSDAFFSCDRLTTAILNCDADIPASAFESCEYLSEVQVNGSPKKIGAKAFYECSRLKSITLPEGVEEIGASAFASSGLRSIDLPESLEKIGENAFYRCSSLGSIDLPDSLKVIGTGAFSETSIDTLNIGENVESIGMGYGTGLFSVAEANPNYSSKGGALYDKSGKKLILYWGRSKANHLSVPAGTETIGEGAFVYANDLRQLDFPETLVSIEKEALPADAWNLEIVFPKSLRTVGENNMSASRGNKIYYRGFAAEWDGIDIDYYGNDGLTENPDIVYNHKKTGLKLAKTKVSCTCAENPKIKVTYSDGSRVRKSDIRLDYWWTFVRGESYADYIEIMPQEKRGTKRICVVAGGCAADIDFEVTGPTPLSKCKFKWGYIDEYNGKAQKPYFDLKAPDGSYINSSDYTVKYQNNVNVGTAKAVITGTEKCSGSITKTFVIAPKRPDMTRVTGGTRSAVVKWKKITKQVTGYQIQYSLNRNFKSPKTITVKGYNTTSRKITGLKSNKMYRIRMRTYRTTGGKTYYSRWSSTTWDVYTQ